MRAVFGSTVFALVGASLLALPAEAQNSWQQVVNGQLATHGNTLRGQGFSSMAQPITGSLNDDGDMGTPVALNAGMEYAIVGVCDQDCRDVDLRIFGPDGTMIAEDLALDDHPVLHFRAPATGQYRLVIMMANCTANPCYWGVQVFGK